MKSTEDISPERPAEVFFSSSGAQKITGALAIFTAIVATAMTIAWADKHDADKKYLGGLNWDEKVFNWHPVLMVTGMVFFLACSLVSYRVMGFSKNVQKIVHGIMHTGAIICILTGLAAVVTSHNYTNHNNKGTYSPNLYSMHSLIGMSAIVLYLTNYILGILNFALPGSNMNIAKAFKPHHIFFGICTLFVGAMAIESGIAELSTKLGCTYHVTSGDWNPADNYHRLSAGCRLSNGIGIIVLITVLLCAYTLFGPGRSTTGTGDTTSEPSQEDSIFSKLFL